MESLDVVALLTALGVGGVISKVVDWWIKRANERREKDKAFTHIFEAINSLYFQLQVMLRESYAERVTLLKTTNGGGRPKLSGRLYSSVIYEVFEYPLKSVKASWQNQLLDPAYMQLLYQANQSGFLRIKTAELPAGILKNLYKKSSIAESWVFIIHERETEFIYMSVNFTKEQEETPELNDLFRVGVSSLSTLFKNNKKI